MARPYVIHIDYEKCTGCQSCTIACALKREGVCSLPLGRIQVSRWEAEGIHVPIVCQQCEDAPCMRVCPVSGALTRDPETQVVTIDYDRCIGCRYCVLNCPFGAMLVNPITRRVMKCDHCEGDPVCVKFCYTKAIQYLPLTHALYAKRTGGAQKVVQLLSSIA